MMHVGETWEFALPAALAYGEHTVGSDDPERASIPKNSALVFRIALLKLGHDCYP